MNVDDLWIGDRLLVKSINETGKFEGITANGNLIIQLNIGTVEVTQNDVTLAPDESKPTTVYFAEDDDKKNNPVKKTPFKNKLDLHFESLMANQSKSNFKNILSHQIAECRKFIQQAIKRKEAFVTIIHGKGEGILKKEIEKLLVEYEDSIFTQKTENQGGAITVYFKI